MKQPSLKMKKGSVRLAIVVFALFLAFAALASFGVIDLTEYNQSILTVSAALIVFIEVGLASVIKKKGKGLDLFSFLGIIAATIVLVTLALQWMGVAVAVLEGIQGIVFAVLVVSFIIEAMR